MPAPILTTKLYIPIPDRNIVSRQRLLDTLMEGLSSKLTVISAPAGFGKTTVAAHWITACNRPVGWISLEKEENDADRFMAYLIAALQNINKKWGDEIPTMLNSPRHVEMDTILTVLINEISTFTEDFILVLDDYHIIESPSVDRVVTFILDHLPTQMHLVIISREDPDLPVSRMRARNQICELRSSDLRFTPEEIKTFLNEKKDLDLCADEINVLENRTEGWITGLQLAAISLRGSDNKKDFIRSFSGSHYFILDYLMEEVLHNQPAETVIFLLYTSIVDRLCPSLCDALYPDSSSSGEETLQYLQQINLFLISLDSERKWFRYHHLLRDILQQRLGALLPVNKVKSLHLRASVWYEEHNFFTEAIDHSILGGNPLRTADLLELSWPRMEGTFQSPKWLEWASSVSESILSFRPVLCAAYAMALMDAGRLENIEKWLNLSGDWLNGEREKEEMVVVDKLQFSSLGATIASTRAYLAQISGNVEETRYYSRLCLNLASKDQYQIKAGAFSLIGISHWAMGELEEAHLNFLQSIEGMKKDGNVLFAIAIYNALGDIIIEKGCLNEAFLLYNNTLRLADELNGKSLWVLANTYLGLTKIHLEWNDIASAGESLKKSKDLCKYASLENTPYLTALAQASLQEALNDFEGASRYLDKAKENYMINPAPEIRPIDIQKICLWIRQGKLNKASIELKKKSLILDGEIPFFRSYDYIAFIRLFLAEYREKTNEEKFIKTMRLIRNLQSAAERGAWNFMLLELLVLKLTAYEIHNERDKALSVLDSIIPLAEPEGYIRIFLEEANIFKELLAQYKVTRKYNAYLNKLLSALEHKGVPSPNQTLLEPLSPRELEILQLISRGLSNKEIADQLYLALTTIKGYNRNLFLKLNVQRRTEAVAKAKELGIL